MKKTSWLIVSLFVSAVANFANVPGGATTSADVTLMDNGASVILDNGIVSITVTKASGTITNLTYYGENLLSGGNNGGQIYWELQSGNGAYLLEADPKTNGGNIAEVRLHMQGSVQDVDIDYALLRGSSGFYAAGILSHPAGYPALNGGEWRVNVYLGSTFDWLSVDAKRNKLMCAPADWNSGVAVAGAPMEVELLTHGIYKGQYECKYTYSADFGEEEAWGWSSTAKNIGVWVTLPSIEYYNGGPKKRELTCHTGPALLNMFGGSHYGMGNSEIVAAGESMRKIYGPFFYYVNKVPAATANAPAVLFNDAIAQSKAEQSAWPYSWFKDTGYVQESGRGSIKGTFVMTDTGNPHASPAGMWIGLAPDNGIDFQFQFFSYQFWTKTETNGDFIIPHVIPGTYALYAFGPGAAGSFKMSPVMVSAGQALNLGVVRWTPPRTASTVWEIGIPDRDSHEFLNGDSLYGYWQTSYVNYPKDFPNGIVYTVGTDAFAKTWNYSMMDTQTWKVNFTLPHAPTTGSRARFYVALASSFGSHLVISANGNPLAGFAPKNPSDAVVRLGSHGAFWDTAIVFNAELLKTGANTLSITQRGGTLEWDYVRLEADGTGVTSISQGLSSKKMACPAVFLKKAALTGDGIHAIELLNPSGQALARCKAGQTLDLSDLPRGIYFARCNKETKVIPWISR